MTTATYEFAGFTFPRKVARWVPKYRRGGATGGRGSPWCFAYTSAPPPVPSDGASFYLDSDFMPGLRWQWCDEVDRVRITHTGWHADPHGDGETIRGIVLRLPRSRGFLAGWSMGKGMASEVSREVYASEVKAAYAADREAEAVAEAERERAEHWQAGQAAGETWREAMKEARDNLATSRRERQEARDAAALALSLRGAVQAPPAMLADALALYRASLEAARERLTWACEARRDAWHAFRKASPSYDRDAMDAFREGAGL